MFCLRRRRFCVVGFRPRCWGRRLGSEVQEL
jgi:hypothetical protein